MFNRALSKIPVNRTFTDVHEQVKNYIVPPNVARFLFIFMVSTTLSTFIISFYFSQNHATKVTIIDYKLHHDPYFCKALSPLTGAINEILFEVNYNLLLYNL